MCEAYATGREIPPHPDTATTAALTGGGTASKEEKSRDRWQMRNEILPRFDVFKESNPP